MFRFTVAGEEIAIPPGGSAGWTLSYGVKPNVETFTTTKATVDAILARADLQFPLDQTRTKLDPPVGPVSIVMEDLGDNGNATDRRVEVKGLYVVVGNRPGFDYNSSSVTLADRRILFTTRHIEASYNIRRKTGDRRLVGTQLDPIQKGINTPDFAYRRSTLNELEEPYTAREVLEDVLTQLVGGAGWAFKGSTDYLEVPIEGLVLRDRGDAALQRVLAFVPGAQVYADLDGIIRIANIYDQTEEAAFENAGAPNSGNYRKVDRSPLRPRGYRVYSDREIELRFDLLEDGTLRTFTRGREELTLENVIRNPLFRLKLANGEVATQGELIQLDDFLDAMNLIPRASVFSVDLKMSRDTLKKYWFRWQDMSAGYALLNTKEYMPERAKCLGALRNDYRRLFRILPQWRDKIRALLPRRTAVFDAETGTRGPAPVHATYIRKFTMLGIAPHVAGKIATNEDDYGDGQIGEKDTSPFEVTIENADIGLIRITPILDQTGQAEDYVIGSTKDGKLPTSTHGGTVFWGECELADEFKLAVIVTATPDSPNGIGRLHEEFVSVEDVQRKLKLASGSERNAGPVVELYQSAEPARFAWLDELAEPIKEAFYTGAPMPKEQNWVNKVEMRAAALSLAAADYASKLDRVEGRTVHPLQPITPTGNLRSVQYVVTIGGSNELAAFTILTAPGEVEAPPIWAGLPEGVRRKILNLVDQ